MTISVRLAATLLLGVVVLSMPLFVHAFGKAADAMCICTIEVRNPQVPPLCKTLACYDTGSPTVGVCSAPQVCAGKTAGGTPLDASLGQLGQLLGQLMGKLMQGQPSQPSTPTTPPLTTTGCQGPTFQTSDITQLSNPCAQYVAPNNVITGPGGTTTGNGACDTLSQLLGTCGTSDTTNTNTNDNANFNDRVNPPTTQHETGSVIQNVFNASSTSGLGVPGVLAPSQGSGGDITLLNNGATIYGYMLNPVNNTGVAGFFGGNGSFAPPQGLAATMCQNRPWAGGFVASLIPPTFFDNLCTWRGYRVGPPPAPQAPVVQLQQTQPTKKPPTTAPAATSTPTVPAMVRIWAVPASVPLDTRTSVFWSTQGVTDCTESSPDGNFSHASLSGGAATVPLAGATTYTISCLDSGGNPVTDFVTVNIKI